MPLILFFTPVKVLVCINHVDLFHLSQIILIETLYTYWYINNIKIYIKSLFFMVIIINNNKIYRNIVHVNEYLIFKNYLILNIYLKNMDKVKIWKQINSANIWVIHCMEFVGATYPKHYGSWKSPKQAQFNKFQSLGFTDLGFLSTPYKILPKFLRHM